VQLAGAGQLGWQLRKPFGTGDASRDHVTEQYHHLRKMHTLGELDRSCPGVAVPRDLVESSMKLGASLHTHYRRWRRRGHLRGPARRDIAPGGLGVLQLGTDLAIKVTESMGDARADALRRTAVCTSRACSVWAVPARSLTEDGWAWSTRSAVTSH
jgi:hypothetical protein